MLKRHAGRACSGRSDNWACRAGGNVCSVMLLRQIGQRLLALDGSKRCLGLVPGCAAFAWPMWDIVDAILYVLRGGNP
jgi:hypothetical protein